MLEVSFNLKYFLEVAQETRAAMSAAPTYSSSSLPESDSHRYLLKEVRSHEVSIAELSNLPASRAVYQRNGNLFFRTTFQKAIASEQKQVDMVKSKLQKLSS
ncbi:uncharacterized protein LOC129889062 isoform X2 [Solanum dulcamara]|uniref:uncharacterized protein LOC129889062 isoform X2 n=1 Tax=Solanum dulcamara TaxID=45834 RepID=UPI0024866DD2|nr:uncharacterized protein LOC129889062 isoform X2 [Solanum dulcamara]